MKVIQHSINGFEYTLDFGRMNFLRLMGEVLGIDPLTDIAGMMNDINKQYDFITALFYAGVNTYRISIGEQPLSIEDAKYIIGNAIQEEAAELVVKFTQTINNKQGEVEVPPTSQSDGTNSDPKPSDK